MTEMESDLDSLVNALTVASKQVMTSQKFKEILKVRNISCSSLNVDCFGPGELVH